MTAAIPILAILGFLSSSYAFWIYKSCQGGKNTAVLCNISNRFSCTKPITSRYGSFMGVANGLWGMIFYTLIFVLYAMGELNVIFTLSVLAVIGSIALAYVLYVKLKSFCIICNSIYLVNILLLLVSSKYFF